VSQSYRLKITRQALRLKVSTRIPAQLIANNFLTITKANGIYTFDVDYTLLDSSSIIDPATAMLAVLDESAGIYKIGSLSVLLANTSQIEQHITASGPATINNNTGIARVDQTVGAAITLNLPAASAKTCPVLVCDWKGDAGTNNITIAPNGSEKIQGLSSWTLAGDNSSIFLRPISGVGYVI
jgi:hypothetical protein